MMAIMHFGRIVVLVTLLLLANAVSGERVSRTPLKGSPTILGREISRFILSQPIRINRLAPGLTNRDLMDRLLGQILPGQFVPVSEDAKGIYYQAARGFQSEGHTSSQPAGLYVSKAKPNAIFAYLGEARELTEELTIDSQRLSLPEMAKLKIGSGNR